MRVKQHRGKVKRRENCTSYGELSADCDGMGRDLHVDNKMCCVTQLTSNDLSLIMDMFGS